MQNKSPGIVFGDFEASVPLVSDLDGTLTKVDTLHESLIQLVRSNPIVVFQMPFWLKLGKAEFKRKVVDRVLIDPSLLPYDTAVIEYVRQARSEGRRTVLATAADSRIAHAVAEHLDLFDEVLATSGACNLSGADKRDVLVNRFGQRGYDYIANSYTDQPVWSEARKAILANAFPALVNRLTKEHKSVEIISIKGGYVRSLWEAMRAYKWAKNLLVFISIFVGHHFSADNILQATVTFLCFSAAASSVSRPVRGGEAAPIARRHRKP